jgi:L-serine dehydratase
MKTLSAFNVLGPVMVGPSSSHTAGAARLAAVAASIAGPSIRQVTFTLYGSFADTYLGHGTDRALLAGILGLSPDDQRLPLSYTLAQQQNLRFLFVPSDKPTNHPNTISIDAINAAGRQTHITGVSVGGGEIEVTNIDGVEVSVTGEYPTLIVEHIDKPGMVALMSQALSSDHINIAFMRVFRDEKGGKAYTVIETDQSVPAKILNRLRDLHDEVVQVYWIEGIK